MSKNSANPCEMVEKVARLPPSVSFVASKEIDSKQCHVDVISVTILCVRKELPSRCDTEIVCHNDSDSLQSQPRVAN